MSLEDYLADTAFIACDECGQANAKLRCARCKCAWYCSAECQKKHWKAEQKGGQGTHKALCAEISKRHAKEARRLEAAKAKASPMAGGPEVEETNCTICKHQMATVKTKLPCEHEFCLDCVTEYRKAVPNARCPLCRRDMPDDHVLELQEDAALLMQAANDMAPESPDRKELFRTAADKLDGVLAIVPDHIGVQCSKVEALEGLREYREAVSLLKQSISITAPGLMLHGKVVGNVSWWNVKQYVMLASLYYQLEEYDEAYEAVREVWKQLQPEDIHNVRKVLHLGSQICYYKGLYDQAVEFGESAIEMNRSYPGVYRHVALAYHKKGDIDKAILTMQKAVKFESPWLPEEVEKLRGELTEFVDLKLAAKG